jgi:hypothetical protein
MQGMGEGDHAKHGGGGGYFTSPDSNNPCG